MTPRPSSYAVYRIPVTDQRVKADDCVVADATNLVATMRAVSGCQTWTDTSAGGQRYTYVVTDSTGVERVGSAAGHAPLIGPPGSPPSAARPTSKPSRAPA